MIVKSDAPSCGNILSRRHAGFGTQMIAHE